MASIETIKYNFETNIDEILKKFDELDKSITNLKRSSVSVDVDTSALEDARREIEALEKIISQLEKANGFVNVDYDDVSNAQTEVSELEKELTNVNKQKTKIDIDDANATAAKEEIQRLDEQLNQLDRRQTELELQYQDIIEAQEELEGLVKSLSQVNQQKVQIDISHNIQEVGSAIDNLGSKILNPFASKLAQVASLATVFSVVRKGINVVTSSVGSAISRLDTLNNSARVFQNIGVGADEAEREIENLSESINGLPTALDDAVQQTQLLTSTTGDMAKSVKTYSALNNAVLGFGGSANETNRAVQMLSNSFGQGKIDGQTWNSFVKAGLTPTLNALASKMGKTTTQLREGLSKGTISVEAFQDALIDLNENGGGGLESLQKIAQDATGGIATSMQNAKTAISRGVASILDSVNNALSGTEFGGIGGLFTSIGKGFEKGLKSLGETIENNRDRIVEVFNGIWERIKWVGEQLKRINWGSVWEGFKESINELKDTANGLLDTLKPVVRWAKNYITELGNGDFYKGLGKLPALLVKVGLGIKLVGKSLKLLGKFSNFSIGGKTKDGGLGGLAGIDWNKQLDKIVNVGVVYAMVKIVQELAEAVKQLDEKVPEFSKSLALKLASMAAAIGAIGVIVTAVGLLTKTSGGTQVAIKGLVAVAAISVEIMLVAEAVKQIDDKVPEISTGFAKKIGTIAAAIGAMGLIVAAVGALLATGVVLAAVALGLAGVAAVALEMMLVAEAIQQFDKKVPEDSTSVITKIENMAEIIAAFTESNIGNLIDVFSNIVAVWNIDIVRQGIESFIELAEVINRFMDQAVIPTGVEERIEDFVDITKAFQGTDFKTLFKNFLQGVNIGVVTEGIESFIMLGETLKKFEKVDIDKGEVITRINDLNEVIDYIGNKNGGGIFSEISNFFTGIDTSSLANVTSAVSYLIAITDQLNSLRVIYVGKEYIIEKIQTLSEVIEEINRGFSSVVPIDSYVMEQVAENVKAIVKIRDEVNQLGGKNVLADKAKKAVVGILEIVTYMGEELTKGLTFLKTETIERLENTVDAILRVRDSINQLGGKNLLYEDAKKVLREIRSILQSLGDSVLYDLQFLGDDKVNNLVNTVDAMVKVRDSINQLGGKGLIYEQAIQNISKLKVVLSLLNFENFGYQAAGAGDIHKHLDKAYDTVDKVINVTNRLNALGGIELQKTKIQNLLIHVKDVIKDMSDFPAVNGIDAVKNLVKEFSDLVTELNGLVGKFKEVGTSYGEHIIDGFKSAEVQKKIVKMINDLIKELQKNKYKEQFKSIGKNWGAKLREGFKEEIEHITSDIQTIISSIDGLQSEFRNAGTTLGNSFRDGFNDAVSSLSTSVGNQLSTIQTSLDSLTLPTFDIDISTNNVARPLSTGGFAGDIKYLSSGGNIFKPRGTDTVPAMLTPGEPVSRVAAAKKFGSRFFEKINKLDVDGVMNELNHRFGIGTAPISNTSIQNNTYYYNNDNHATINQTMGSGNVQHGYNRANRYVRGLA